MPQSSPGPRRLVVALVIVAAVSICVIGSRREPRQESGKIPRTGKVAFVEQGGKVADAMGAESEVVASRGAQAVVAENLYAVGTTIPGARGAGRLPHRFAVPSTAETVLRMARVTSPDRRDLQGLRSGDGIVFRLLDGSEVKGRVNLATEDSSGQTLVGGELMGGAGGSFSLGAGSRGFGGRVVPAAGRLAYVFEKGNDGAVYLVEKERDHVMCVELPVAPVTGAEAPVAEAGAAGGVVAAAELPLSSRPTATAVIYLDFDGETVTDSSWNGGSAIVASDSGLNSTQITEVWRRVSEDYRAFNVDVTTVRSRYDNAAVGSRMRCIITQNSGWYGSAGGVAYITSWGVAGQGGVSATIPCWVFANLLGGSTRYIAEATTHEVGHTLGLSHDGLMDGQGVTTQSYYAGHGSGATSWAPIMGSGYYSNLIQWSKGEYGAFGYFANNTEDDLAIISDVSNNVPYMGDDAAGTRPEASALRMSGATSVSTIGTIERRGEVDVYMFRTSGGTVNFNFVGEVAGAEGTALANLDARATLTDSAGTVLADSDPAGGIWPSLSATVSGGTYYLSVTGVGEGAVNATGYSNYGSIGRYEITGSVPAAAPQAPVLGGASAVTAAVGTSFSYQIEAIGSPTSYGATGLPAGLTVNTTSGLISGAPTSAGSFSVTLTATNGSGSANKTLTIGVTTVLGAALEAGSLAWTTVGSAPWTVETGVFHDGTSSARSGSIGANGDSWIEATVNGPGTLSFWWSVSSQLNGDYLRVKLDGVEQASISGNVSWTQRSVTIGAGTHVVRWSYTKNGSGTSGTDAGWIDGVNFVASPAVTSATTARAVVGMSFSYQILAVNTPTSFGATGLPAGLSVNTSTGLISGTTATSATLGVANVTLSATNAFGTGTLTLQLDVKTGFAAWVQDNSLIAEAAQPGADPDGDGASNLVEYSLKTNPMVRDSAVWPQVSSYNDNGTMRLEIVFVRPLDRPDVVYSVEVSSNMSSWTTGHTYGPGASSSSGAQTQEVERLSLGAAGEQIRVRDIGGSGSSMRFIHLRMSVP